MKGQRKGRARGASSGSEKIPGEKERGTPGREPDLSALAGRYLDLWQAQMATGPNLDGLSLPASTADMDNTGIFREPWKVTSARK